MISCYLFGFAIPLAVCVSPVLRLAVWLYTALFGAMPAPVRQEPRPEIPGETAAAREGDGSELLRPGSPQGYRNAPTTESATAGTEEEPQPIRIPPYKTAFAMLLLVLVVTSFVSGFGVLLSMAILEVLRSKGIFGSTDLSMVYTGTEIVFLSAGFLFLAWLLQEWLPTRYPTACIVAAIYLGLLMLATLVLVGALWVLLYLVRLVAPHLAPTTPLDTAVVVLYGLVLFELAVGLVLLTVWLLLAPFRWALTGRDKTASA